MHFCFDLDLLLFVDKMVCICPNALVGKLHFWSLISMTKIVFVPHFFYPTKNTLKLSIGDTLHLSLRLRTNGQLSLS